MLIGAVLVAVGLAVAIPMEGTPAGIGVAISALGAVPLMAGLGMWLAGVVERRSRAGKPFA
jgi:hypothetical protein